MFEEPVLYREVLLAFHLRGKERDEDTKDVSMCGVLAISTERTSQTKKAEKSKRQNSRPGHHEGGRIANKQNTERTWEKQHKH